MFKTVKQALFSSGLQSPTCTALENEGSEYETRQYEAAKWVSTGIGTLNDWDSVTGSGFMRLFNYIQGNNEKKVKIDMTVPVTTFIQPGEGPACESSLTMSFFIPNEHQEEPPKPSDVNVFIEERPQMTVYVSVFSHIGKGFKIMDLFYWRSKVLFEVHQEIGSTREFSSSSGTMSSFQDSSFCEVRLAGFFPFQIQMVFM
uniref:Uncharacterized protein n=1 Tax=Leptobrachium leishanense TaxID=445787 RepID=A0A8C5QFR5_9ANUR